MCSINAHNNLQPTYVDDSSSVGGIAITKNAITAELEPLYTWQPDFFCWYEKQMLFTSWG